MDTPPPWIASFSPFDSIISIVGEPFQFFKESCTVSPRREDSSTGKRVATLEKGRARTLVIINSEHYEFLKSIYFEKSEILNFFLILKKKKIFFLDVASDQGSIKINSLRVFVVLSSQIINFSSRKGGRSAF